MYKGHTKKQDGNWYIVLELGRDEKTGRRRRQVISVRKELGLNGKATSDEADELLVKKLNEIRTGTYVEPSERTVEDWLEEWINEHVDVKIRTLESYKEVVNLHIIPEIGDMKLAKLQAYDIQRLLNRKRKGGRLDGKPGGLSNTRVRYIYRVINMALGKAKQFRLITFNPCTEVTPPKKVKSDIRFWTKKEGSLFLEYVSNNRLYPLYLLALTTGMRLGELLGLRWMDIDFSNSRISINQTLSQTKEGLILQPTAKSDSSKRTLDVPPEVIAVLEEYRKFQRFLKKDRESGPEKIDRKELAFQTKNKTPIRPRNIERAFERLVEKLNEELWEERQETVEHITFHGMRHTFAVIQLQEYLVPVETVSEMLGHSDIKTTLESYSHVIPKKKKEAAQNMNDLIPKKK